MKGCIQPLNRAEYRQALEAIHQESVRTVQNSYFVHGVLAVKSLPIADAAWDTRGNYQGLNLGLDIYNIRLNY